MRATVCPVGVIDVHDPLALDHVGQIGRRGRGACRVATVAPPAAGRLGLGGRHLAELAERAGLIAGGPLGAGRAFIEGGPGGWVRRCAAAQECSALISFPRLGSFRSRHRDELVLFAHLLVGRARGGSRPPKCTAPRPRSWSRGALFLILVRAVHDECRPAYLPVAPDWPALRWRHLEDLEPGVMPRSRSRRHERSYALLVVV